MSLSKSELNPCAIWSTEKTMQLIEMLREAPVLWKIKHSDYLHPIFTRIHLREIASTLKVPEAEIDLKIRVLKSHFRRERNKCKEQNGSATTPRNEWFGYQALSFLHENYESNSPKKRKADETETICGSTDAEINANPISISYDSGNSTTIQIPKSQTAETMSQAYVVNESNDFTTSVQRCVAEKDDYTIYGENVASRMRVADRSKRAVSMAKNRIDNILFQLEMGEFDEETFSTATNTVSVKE